MLSAQISDSGRTGGRSGPGDAAAGVEPDDERRHRARDHGAGILPQPAGAGGCVRPCGHHEQGQSAPGAQPQRPAGEHCKAPGGLEARRGPGSAAGAGGPPHLPRGPCLYLYRPRKGPGDYPAAAGPPAPDAGGSAPVAGGNFHL